MVSKNTPRIILGIDPGLHHTGWGVIKLQDNKSTFLGCSTISTNPKDEMQHRLLKISDGIAEAINSFKPDEAAIEEVFVNKNNLSSLKLGHARGAIMLTAAQKKVNCTEYSATHIKKTIVGKGRAEKQQIDMMVKILLPKSNPKTDHEADALAIALTHANSNPNLY